MKYKITYSDAFKKHYKKLSDIEKAQTKKKISFCRKSISSVTKN